MSYSEHIVKTIMMLLRAALQSMAYIDHSFVQKIVTSPNCKYPL